MIKSEKQCGKNYAKTAITGNSSCCCPSSSCCGTPNADDMSVMLGYSKGNVSSVPEGANMGLGCGNPQAIAGIKNWRDCA